MKEIIEHQILKTNNQWKIFNKQKPWKKAFRKLTFSRCSLGGKNKVISDSRSNYQGTKNWQECPENFGKLNGSEGHLQNPDSTKFLDESKLTPLSMLQFSLVHWCHQKLRWCKRHWSSLLHSGCAPELKHKSFEIQKEKKINLPIAATISKSLELQLLGMQISNPIAPEGRALPAPGVHCPARLI